MTEWEMMLAGLPQNDRAPELEARRMVAKRLFRAYNKTTEEESAVREKIKKQLFRHVGKMYLSSLILSVRWATISPSATIRSSISAALSSIWER